MQGWMQKFPKGTNAYKNKNAWCDQIIKEI